MTHVIAVILIDKLIKKKVARDSDWPRSSGKLKSLIAFSITYEKY